MATRSCVFDVEYAAELYADGMTLMQLGDKFGCSFQTIRRRFKESGIQMRRPGKEPSQDANKIIELHRQGYSGSQIGEMLGCNPGLATEYLRRNGISTGHGNVSAKPIHKACKECGQSFDTNRRDKLYCSRTCMDKHFSRIRHDRKRAHNAVDDIPLAAVYERDNGICYICGERCDWNDHFSNVDGYFVSGPKYPTRDHVKPLAKGGTHTWDNVRLACFRCNSGKSDKPLMEVMRGA